MGFVKGLASACVFTHAERELTCSVYGDDFTCVGRKNHLDWFKTTLESKYELVEQARLGPGKTDDKEGKILNRVIRWTNEGLEYEADPRQREKLLRDLGLDGANALSTPGVRETAAQLAEDKALESGQHTAPRAVAARANYLASDRPDFQFAAKEICRWMSAPHSR